MPLLRKKTLERPNDMLDLLKDDDEVFYCEVTKELFRNYEEYCERIILVNSMVWSCSMTGKSNLTYAEALKSEKEAVKTIKKFPRNLRVPIIYLASQTKRKNLKDMLEDVFLYAKDNYFIGEKVQVYMNNEWVKAKVTSVKEEPRKDETSAPVYTYDVKLLPIESDSKVLNFKSGLVQRKKGTYNRPKNKLFLKQYVEQADGMFRIKETILNKYNIRKMKFSDIFVGDKPIFNAVNKKSPDLNNSMKQKQESIAKYFKKVDGSPTMNKSETKLMNGDSKSLKDKPFAVKKSSEEIRQKILNDKKLLKEQKQLQKMSGKDIEARLHKFIRHWHMSKEDLELTDQHAIPASIPIDAFFSNKQFGEFIMVLEFLETFNEELNVKESFPHGVTWEILERALTLKEINGPLHDIFQMLLVYIFNAMSVEYSANHRSTRPVPLNFSTPKEGTMAWYIEHATLASRFANTQFNTFLTKKQLDAVTLSEILRLHLLSSGSRVRENLAKYRSNQRGGYDCSDDPGLQLRISSPHILKALALCNICQLPRGDILKLLICLMNQILTYTPIRDLVEKRLENSAKAKYELRTLEAAHRKNLVEYNANKQKCVKDLETEASRENQKALDTLEKEHNTYLQKYAEQCDDLLRVQFSHEIYLGSDRCHRRYWLFESVPGLFVEDHEPNAGSCLPNIVQQHPVLSTCDSESYITNLKKIFREHHKITHDKENNDVSIISKLVNNNTVVDKNTLHDKALELNMCTADNGACRIHGDVEKVRWSFYYKKEEVDALIDSLNKRGVRERYLLDNLKQWRELIYDHIENCPLEKLTKHLKGNMGHRPKMKYHENDTNLNHPAGTEPSTILKNTLIEFILELYEKITNGCLGKLQVDDEKAWSDGLRNGKYDMQCEEIAWGKQHDNKMFVKKRSGEVLSVIATVKEETKSENGDDNENEEEKSDEEDEDLESDYILTEGQGYYDPGSSLGPTMDIESEDSEEEICALHESSEQKEILHDLSCALLQVAQSVYKQHMQYPFGGCSMKTQQYSDNILKYGKRRFRKWEISLMNSTSFAQIFSHYHAIEQCIIWKNSVENSSCKICKKKSRPDHMLLCDSCNCAIHMDCNKPPIKSIPEGDWFCDVCKPPTDKKSNNRSKKSRQSDKNKMYDEDEPVRKKKKSPTHEMNGYDSENEVEDLPNGVHQSKSKSSKRASSVNNASSLVPLCDSCRSGGELISCNMCSTSWHIECIKPAMRRVPRGKWACSQCMSKSNAMKRSLDTTANQTDSSMSSDNESNTPARKSRRKDQNGDYVVSSPAVSRSKQIDGFLADIGKHRDSWPFMSPVTLEEVPDYFDVISNPMDFGTIRDKLKNGDYTDEKDLVRDIALVFENCDTYNNGDSDVFKAGAKLLKFVLKRGQELNFEFPDSIKDGFVD